MLTHRCVALAIMLTGLAAKPVLAETCSLTVEGAAVLDDEPCVTSMRAGVLRVTQGGREGIVIRGSVLRTSLVTRGPSLSKRSRSERLRSFGAVVRSDSNDEKVCYFNQRVTLCIEQ